VPCLEADAIQNLLPEVPGWSVPNNHHLFRAYSFPDFKTALAFVNRVGAVAEEQGHHPDLLLTWGKVEITIFTHKIDGLTESDFVLAAKIEQLHRQ
jgi:4a-hydroxytetrahydrobiopterin dehydratase